MAFKSPNWKMDSHLMLVISSTQTHSSMTMCYDDNEMKIELNNEKIRRIKI